MPRAVLWVRGSSDPLPPKAAGKTRREAATIPYSRCALKNALTSANTSSDSGDPTRIR